MSLLLWAPLTTGIVNNTIENQGLSPAIFNRMNHNGKIASNNNGKLGTCIERTASGYADCYRSSVNFNLTGDISMMCWAYVSATVGDTANGLITNHNHADNSGLGITVKQVSTSDYRISCSTGNGSTRTYMTYYGTTNIKNAWHHLALTYNKSKKTLKLYVDGNCEYTLTNYDNYAANNPFDLFNWSTGHYTNGDYRPVCKLNDVRLYDNELSQAEVKKISRGLMIHIAMNGGRSNPNLVADSLKDAGQSHSTYPIQDYNFTEATIDGQVYTITIKANLSSEKKSIGVWHTGGSYQCGSMAQRNDTGLYTWQFTGTSTMASQTGGLGYGFARVYVSNNNGTQGSTPVTGTANVEWIKIEKGSKSTSWIPSTADTNYSNMGMTNYDEPDISGFGNKAMKYGSVAFSYTDNSPRNSTCITFANNSHIYINSLKTSAEYINIYSFAWWGKVTNANNTMMWGLANGNRNNVFISGGYLFWNTGDGGSNPFGSITSASIADGNWHHFVVTSNGSVVKLYIDGVYKADAKTWKGLGNATNIVFNGWALSADYNFNGSLSDWRMYTTCLSADDVKELYSISASITDNGTILASEFVEN